MCKTTKGTQAAAGSQLIGIQPNAGGGGGGGGTQPAITIKREHVPETVFIAQASPTDNGFIASANTFHNFFGFRGNRRRTFTSMQHLVQMLAEATVPIARIRIVAHADNTGIFSPMVQNDERVTIEKAELRDFIAGDGKWLLRKTGLVHFIGTGSNAVQAAQAMLSHILQSGTHASTLAPFNYTSTSSPNTVLTNFVLCSATPMIISGNFLKRGSTNLTAAQKTAFTTAYNKILELQTSLLLSSGSFAGVNSGHLSALRSAVTSFTFADYNITPGTVSISPATVDSVVRSVAALNDNFRGNLLQVQQRFTTSSWIDIRGCRAGIDADYLTAVSEFFGRSGNRPHVSGPKQFQMFPGIGFVDSPDAASIDNVLNNGIAGISSSDFKNALDEWLKATAYDDAYFNNWHTALNSKAAVFCLLTWRTSIPTTFLIREGKHVGLTALNFADTIKRVKSILGIAASAQPTAAVLTGLQNFVTNDLPGYMQQLTQPVPAAGPYTTLFNALKSINDTLAAGVVPASLPAGLTQQQAQQYQTGLIDFISTNKLQHINTLLQTAKTRVNGSNGKYHLFLLFGLPGIVAFPSNFLNSRIFVISSERNNALRIFLREMWEEALPTPNSVTGALLDNSHSAHRAVSALSSDHSNTTVALAPMPAYFEQIVTI